MNAICHALGMQLNYLVY